jgi:hypothetical protein
LRPLEKIYVVAHVPPDHPSLTMAGPGDMTPCFDQGVNITPQMFGHNWRLKMGMDVDPGDSGPWGCYIDHVCKKDLEK